MKNKIKLIFLTFLLCINCNKKNPLHKEKKDKSIWFLGMKDTTIKQQLKNSYLIYQLQGDSVYKIKWGNKFFNNESTKKFEVLGNGILEVLASNNNSIVLSQGCGSSCMSYVFLPLKNNIKESTYLFSRAYDLKHNLVAYIPMEEENFLTIENFITKRRIEIKETNLCAAAFKADCIDTIYFKNEYLIIRWDGKKDSKETLPHLIEKKYLVESLF
jgi:hypothetical protein